MFKIVAISLVSVAGVLAFLNNQASSSDSKCSRKAEHSCAPDSTPLIPTEVAAPKPKLEPAPAKVEPRPTATPAAKPKETLTPEMEALRAEMKTVLGSIYTAEKAFHTEYDRYTTDIRQAGWYSDATMKIRVGFLHAFSPKGVLVWENPWFMNSDSFLGEPRWGAEEPVHYADSAKEIELSRFADHCEASCTADTDRFEAIAVADFGDGRTEAWTINQDKELKQFNSGEATEPK